jgi:hypothetical protein
MKASGLHGTLFLSIGKEQRSPSTRLDTKCSLGALQQHVRLKLVDYFAMVVLDIDCAFRLQAITATSSISAAGAHHKVGEFICSARMF